MRQRQRAQPAAARERLVGPRHSLGARCATYCPRCSLQDFCNLLSADDICSQLSNKSGHVSLTQGYSITTPAVSGALGLLLDVRCLSLYTVHYFVHLCSSLQGLYDVGGSLQQNSNGQILGCLIAPDAYLHAGSV